MIEALVQLQDLHEEAKSIDLQMGQLPKMLERQRKEQEKIEKKREELTDELTSLQQQDKEAESRATAIDDRMERLKERERQVATQREFEALERENHQHTSELSRIKERRAGLSNKMDRMKELIEEVDGRLNEQRERYTEMESKIDQQVEELKTSRAELDEKIKTIEPNIPDDVLSDFYQVMRTKGSGLVRISSLGICQTCNISIPPQTVNEIRLAKQLNRCSTCGRFRYVDA